MYNNTTDTLFPENAPFSPLTAQILQVVHVIIAVFGIIGNGTIVVAFVLKLVPITPFMLLLLNLSVADIVVELSIFPFVLLDVRHYASAFPKIASILCAVIDKTAPGYTAGSAVSVTIAYISIIRAGSFDIGPQNLLKKKYITFVICAGWMLGILTFSPHYIRFTFDPVTRICIHKNPVSYQIVSATAATIFWFVPLFTMMVNFLLTVQRMWRKNNLPQSSMEKHRTQVTYLLFGLTVTYIILITPMTLYFVLRALGNFESQNNQDTAFYRISILIVSLNPVTDALLYAFCAKSFRQGFKNQRPSFKNRIIIKANQQIGIHNKKLNHSQRTSMPVTTGL